MSSPEPSPLNQAVTNIKTQNYQEALDILIPYVAENPRSEAGWYLLSFAIDGTDRKLECLDRVLDINPENEKARKRIDKLLAKSSLKSDQSTPQQRDSLEVKSKTKPTSRWFVILVSLILLSLIGYISWKEIFPTFFPEIYPDVIKNKETTSPSATVTESATEAPTTIPTTTPFPSIWPTYTQIPTASKYDFPLPDESLAQQMDDLQNQVSTLRELGIQIDSPRYLIQQSKVRRLVSSMFEERYTKEEIRDKALVLTALGLIDPSYDLYNDMATNIDEGLGGFYVPWTDELFIIGKEFSTLVKFIFVHEYVHALTDQHFHLEEIGVYPECLHETDRCLSISALIEGDATILMSRWLAAYASDEEINELKSMNFSPTDSVLTSKNLPLPLIIREINFKYNDGQNFVNYLMELGGWERVNIAYKELPDSTEQILHPEKYINKEQPTKVDLPPLAGLMGEDWRSLGSGTLGELTTEMILGSSANYLYQVDTITATKAAAGWGGDYYQAFFRSKSNHTLLVVNWNWDTLQDRDEFWDAMTSHLNKRYFGYKVRDTENDCWAKLNDHYTCLLKSNSNTLWITAPAWDDIITIIDQFPQFK